MYTATSEMFFYLLYWTLEAATLQQSRLVPGQRTSVPEIDSGKHCYFPGREKCVGTSFKYSNRKS